jgi:hypothetical protein
VTRIRYQGRDYHTPAYMPVQERERIEGMNKETWFAGFAARNETALVMALFFGLVLFGIWVAA